MVKRLFKQAGVSVLAGFLMSSAVMAEDMTPDAGDPPDVSIGSDDGGLEVSIDPVDPSDWRGDDADVGDNPTRRTYPNQRGDPADIESAA